MNVRREMGRESGGLLEVGGCGTFANGDFAAGIRRSIIIIRISRMSRLEKVGGSVRIRGQ